MEDFTVEKPEGRNPVLEDSGMGKFRWIAGILLISAVRLWGNRRREKQNG